jgi:histidyl-tRNA synthetase
MSNKLQPVRGTHDILPGEEFQQFHTVITRARELATLYGFQEMSVPIFEATEVFARSMGETSDVVSKEMFTFQTRGEDDITLRPEFTAGIARAFISNGMQQHLPLKLFSTGPLFRYERPQKGRQRQFHQVNFEWLGDGSVEADVETIMLASHLLHSLSDKVKCKLLINTLGDPQSRAHYREALVNYLTPYARDLSEDSQRRLVINPLRILDSKSEQDQRIIADAPKITDSLSEEEKSRFDSVCSVLDSKDKKIPIFYEVIRTPALVRGLDYYTGTVFEFVSESGDLGTQNTVLAGGRYDGLIEQMGGKSTPAIGFAAGVERLKLMMEGNWSYAPDLKIFILNVDEAVSTSALLTFASALRWMLKAELDEVRSKTVASVEILRQKNFKKGLDKANQQKATHVLIFAPDELEKGQVLLKDMTGPQYNLDARFIQYDNTWAQFLQLLQIKA